MVCFVLCFGDEQEGADGAMRREQCPWEMTGPGQSRPSLLVTFMGHEEWVGGMGRAQSKPVLEKAFRDPPVQ